MDEYGGGSGGVHLRKGEKRDETVLYMLSNSRD